MHFTDLPQHTGRNDFVDAVRALHGVPLIPHLSGQLRIGKRRLLQEAHLVYRIGQRLLHIHMLAQRHRGQGDGGVQMIGCRNQHRVDVFLLVEHLPEIRVLPGVPVRFPEFHVLRRGLSRARLEAAVERTLHIREVHIAHRHDVLREHLRHVAHPHAADPHAGDVELRAGGAVAGATEHHTRHDHRAKRERRAVGHKITTGV